MSPRTRVVEPRGLRLPQHPAALDQLGLAAALDALAEGVREERLRPVSTTVAPELDALAPPAALCAYRICEDLLAATVGPLHLRLRLRAPDRLQLVAAAGEGRVPGRFVDAGRLALARARVELAGGAFAVADRRSGGVLVHVDLPLPLPPG
jgi:signal transduction histidine kinase